MRNASLLAAAAVAMMASAQAAAADTGYAIPRAYAPSSRGGNNKSRTKQDRERARSKVAAKSRREQRKRAKR